MERINVQGGELEGRIDGTGEPVLCIHGSVIADTFHSLRIRPEVTDRVRLITYNRRGCARSVHHAGPFSVVQQAADAKAVLDHFGIARAHIIGHSYGGITALQLALDGPERVASLTLLEPALFNVPSAEAFTASFVSVIETYQRGDQQAAIQGFLDLAFDYTDWRPRADPHLPTGWWEQSVADATTFFEDESADEWQFTEVEARRIHVPVLAVIGELSGPFFQEGHALMREWWPSLATATIPGAAHDLQFGNPEAVADLLLSFVAKHRIS